jgi:hypothetical protein
MFAVKSSDAVSRLRLSPNPNKKQSDAHGRRQRLKTPVNKLSCAGWLPHDRDSVSGCLVLETSVGTGRLITGLEDSLRLLCLPPYAPAR